jgi:ligand-binding SRPBCC domain-containing protein
LTRIRFHTLRSEQWVPRPLDEVFTFFSDAKNLDRITPPWLNFQILSVDSDPIHAGSEIRYRLLWHGIPIRWKTEIRRWDAPHLFIDIQRSGPYRLWHHTHRFEADGEGTKISDLVRYALPFGWLGRVVHAWTVRKDVESIFAYRKTKTDELFASARENAVSEGSDAGIGKVTMPVR